MEECGLSNDQSTPSLLPSDLLVLRSATPRPPARELAMTSESNQTAGTAEGANSDILQSSSLSKSSATREFCSTCMKAENKKKTESVGEKRAAKTDDESQQVTEQNLKKGKLNGRVNQMHFF